MPAVALRPADWLERESGGCVQELVVEVDFHVQQMGGGSGLVAKVKNLGVLPTNRAASCRAYRFVIVGCGLYLLGGCELRSRSVIRRDFHRDVDGFRQNDKAAHTDRGKNDE